MAFSLGASGLRLGPGCRIIGGRHISFGENISADRNLWLEAVTSYRSQCFNPRIVIGDCVSFSEGVHISSIASISIGSHSLFGSKIYVSDHNHGIYNGEAHRSPEEAPAYRLLGGGGLLSSARMCGSATIQLSLVLQTIGKGAIVGANSVVRGVVPANTIVAGAPARPIKIFNSNTGSWDKV